eukprot:gene19229-25854_t
MVGVANGTLRARSEALLLLASYCVGMVMGGGAAEAVEMSWGGAGGWRCGRSEVVCCGAAGDDRVELAVRSLGYLATTGLRTIYIPYHSPSSPWGPRGVDGLLGPVLEEAAAKRSERMHQARSGMEDPHDMGRVEVRSLKREIDILERRMLQLRGQSGVGAGAEGGELTLAMEGVGRAPLTSRERIRRDKELHRLKLHVVADMPRDVLADLVQDICIELDVSDATSLPATTRKLMRVMAAAPRMETFIAEVCEQVYNAGAAFVPPALQGRSDPGQVIGILAYWMESMAEGEKMRHLMTAIAGAMQQRVDPAARVVASPGDLLTSVHQLVGVETHALTVRESLAAAEGMLSSQPDAPICQAVRHFQKLFSCPKLEGVITAMNKVYMTVTEQRNMVRDLADSVGCNLVMQRLRQVLEAPATAGFGGAGAGGQPASASSLAPPDASQASVQAALGEEVAALLSHLCSTFSVQTHPQLVGAAEKLVGRLRKLDEVLPRYQRMASQLYDMLRVRTLEEVVPALRDLLASFPAPPPGGAYLGAS